VPLPSGGVRGGGLKKKQNVIVFCPLFSLHLNPLPPSPQGEGEWHRAM